MSTPFQLLLRLPPALRCNALRNLPVPTPPTQIPQPLHRRLITQTAPTTPPKPTRLPKPRQTPNRRPSPAQPLSPKGRGQLLSRLVAHLQTHPSILLYRAPSHTSLYFNAYFTGALLFIFAYYQSRLTPIPSDPTKRPKWYMKLLPLAVASFGAVMGMVFMWTPMKLVRTVELIPAATMGALSSAATGRQRLRVRFVMKTPLPVLGMKEPVVERPLHSVYFNPLVRAADPSAAAAEASIYTSEGAKATVWKNVPLSKADAFTLSNKNTPRPQSTILEKLRVFNSSLINVFPAMARDLRRMANRDGMAYIGAPGMGSWKLDLQGAELLENGRALEEVMLPSSGEETSPLGWLVKWFRR